MKKCWVFALLCLLILLAGCGAASNQDGAPPIEDSGVSASVPTETETPAEPAVMEPAAAANEEPAAPPSEPDEDTAEPQSVPVQAKEEPREVVNEEPPAPQREPEKAIPESPEQAAPVQEEEELIAVAKNMRVRIGTYTFTAVLEDNDAVRELVEMMREGPVTIQMSDYSGFEKVGPFGRSLTANNSQTTTEPGDIVLYNGTDIVMFYGSNSWSYTRLGKVDDLTDWTAALGGGDITAVFTLAE